MSTETRTMAGKPHNPVSKVELRKFSRVMAVAIPLIFGLLVPWLWDLGYPLWPWYVAGVFLVTGQFVPALLFWPHKTWYRLAEALGWFNSRVILSIVYFLLFTPIALFLKVTGKSPLDKKGILHENSYRIITVARDDSHFERPF